MEFDDLLHPVDFVQGQIQQAVSGAANQAQQVAQAAASSAIAQGQAAAGAVVGNALARAQQGIAQTSRTTIINAVVAALLVAAIIGGVKYVVARGSR